MASTPPAEPRRVLEQRSIDYVPGRSGTARCGTRRRSGSRQLRAAHPGHRVHRPELGLSALISFLAIVLGAGVGTFFMAFHANQGRGWGCRR